MKSNWPVKKLGEVATISSGATPSRMQPNYYKEGTIPWVKSGELTSGIVTSTEEQITPNAVDASNLKILPAGTPLLAMYGATAGTAAMLQVPATTNQAVAAIEPQVEIIDPKYAFYFLLYKKNDFINKRVGGAQPNINQAVIKNTEIPIPQLNIQKKIVERLDAVRKAQELCDAQISKTEELFESMLVNIFGSGLKIWSKSKLGELVVFSQLGLVKSKQQQVDNGIPYLKMDAIQVNGDLNVSKAVFVTATTKELEDFKLQQGDFLFNTRNTPELVGKSTVFFGKDSYLFNNNILRLRFKNLLPIFLNAYLHTKEAKGQLNQVKKGTTSVSAIYQSSLFGLDIPVPELPEQQKIVEKLSSVQNYKKLLLKQKSLLAELFNSVLDRCMKGGLVK